MKAYDYAQKGAADFAAKRKDERLFHSGQDNGRLYREGWHAARRAAEEDDSGAGFEHAGQTPVSHRCGDCSPDFGCWSAAEPCRKAPRPTHGTFTVTAGGKTSAPISYKAKPAEVAAAIETVLPPPPAAVPAASPADVPTPGKKTPPQPKDGRKSAPPGQLDLF